MSGHSKWHNIKRKKELNDSKRSSEFTKIGRYIAVAARRGGGDPDSNPSLRLAIDKAKQAKMPKDTIDRAIQRGTGEQSADSLEEVIYEGFGPGGVAFMVLGITDNRNRIVSELKNIFSKYGGTLGHPGSTSYIFAGEGREPAFTVQLSDNEFTKVKGLKETLADLDDVQEVYSNYSKS
jgi:YebC/PmpR family DNA-binding regulatory protein